MYITMDVQMAEMIDLNAALVELGWSRNELARRLGLHRNTVSNWGNALPPYALAYLRLMLGLRRLSA